MKKESFLLKIYNKIRLLIKNSKDIAEDVWKPSNPQRPLNLGCYKLSWQPKLNKLKLLSL